MSDYNPDNSILNSLEIHLRDEKAYLNKNISTETICEVLKCNPRLLPGLVKEEYGMGINRLVNLYRIRHAIELIEDGYLKSRTVESLAIEVGFCSRKTFYVAFKRETGLSPTVFNGSVVDLEWIGLLPR